MFLTILFRGTEGTEGNTMADNHIEHNAWLIANRHGRGYTMDGQKYVFTELASELEEKIMAEQTAVGNFTTQGTSVGGDNAAIAMIRLAESVS